ncbi:hypothetical protein QQ045_030258 [Rhodiola kirilowii]
MATELQAGVDNLKNALVAKFSSGRPPIEEVRQQFLSTWALHDRCSIGAWDAKRILIGTRRTEDFIPSHEKARWSKDISTRREPTITTTWIRLTSLPLELYNLGYIESIVSTFGKFLTVDNRTVSFTNPNRSGSRLL